MKQTRESIFAQIRPQLKSTLDVKLFLLLAFAVVNSDEPEESRWRMFKTPNSIYAIADTGNYYKSTIDSLGNIEIYQGKNCIHTETEFQGDFCEEFKSYVSSSDRMDNN